MNTFHREPILLKLKIKSYCEKLSLKTYQLEFSGGETTRGGGRLGGDTTRGEWFGGKTYGFSGGTNMINLQYHLYLTH